MSRGEGDEQPQVIRSTDYYLHPWFPWVQFQVVEFTSTVRDTPDPRAVLDAMVRTGEYRTWFQIGPFPLHDEYYWPSPVEPSDFGDADFPDMVLELAQWLHAHRSDSGSESDVVTGMALLDRALDDFDRPPWLFRLRERDEEPAADGSYYDPGREFLEYVGVWLDGHTKVFVAATD